MNQDRSFKLGEVQFNLPLIPPLQGWEICELFREAVGRPEVLMSLVGDESDPEKAGKKVIMGLLISMSRDHVMQIRNALFEFVTFKTKDQVKPMSLAGLEDMAFEKLDPFSIYEVMGRCFAANFIGYFKEMLARAGIDASALGGKEDLDTTQ